jgi:cell filamentation protein
VTFDPFGDFETQGYLRNLAKEKDPDIVRRLEHSSFMTGIDAALERLANVKHLSYADLLETHKTLFEAVYPWAGQDRSTTAPDLAISKGPVLFAHPDDIQRAAHYALAHGQDREFMREKPGVIMGYLICTSIPRRQRADHHGAARGHGTACRLQHRLGNNRKGRLSRRAHKRAR